MGSSVSVVKKRTDKSIAFDQKVAYLKLTPFFQYLTSDAVGEFAKCFPKSLSCPPGKNIELESHRIYIVCEGEVDLSTSYPEAGTKVEAKGYLCRKRQGDIVNLYQTKKDIERQMSSKKKKLRMLTEEVITVSSGDTKMLLLCADMDALDKFNKAHPALSKPIHAISHTQIEDRLESIPFLKEVSKTKLGVLAAMCRYEAFENDQVVFEENSKADKLYLVLSGVAKVMTKNPTPSQPKSSTEEPSSKGRVSERFIALQRSLECSSEKKETLVGTDEVVVAELRSGDYFGETALVFNIDRTCSVRTGDKSVFLSVHKTDFVNFLKICPIEESLKEVIKARMVAKLFTLGIPFLGGIPGGMMSALTKSLVIEEIPKDATVFKQGDSGDKFYIVVHGGVKVETVKKGSTEHGGSDQSCLEIGTLGPGQYFGEMALVSGHGLRSATVSSTEKSILLSIENESFKQIIGSNNEIAAEFELRVMKDSAKLEHVLAHSQGISSFREFLEKEHAGENLDFFVAVKNFCVDADGAIGTRLSKEKSKYIFITFCADYADRQINLPSRMREELDIKINGEEDLRPDLFDAALDEIFELMDKDKFPRYKNSEEFKDFLVRLGVFATEGDDL
mmetsp:Transcript_19866/g.41672  ORF Transcript_19866/g.41672 Transcript_19866/m.41672 type:complete len:619 (+) Transcript_19866:1290-3146(+)|eukprot:CAMPEP_0171358420 /NCGR_PEP_ID=MMETSP0878-20121228/46746_1 /TAXON_ID=67004 /ORGANISM="Thalassiosira weissflogii, Strain CCMP1336" /LENGTH=618 /DNA_ID=CAMNT_0011864487 /DNA_START=1117 /DNA_END=2973 /DNA_ORIENTATION=+